MKFKKLLISENGRTFLYDKGQPLHTQFGEVKSSLIEKAKDGELVETNKGEKLAVVEPSFIDRYKRIKRGAQIITLKDAGIILSTTGLGKESVAVESGTGSGAMTIFLARHCKQVYSYDIEKENIELAKQNLDDLGMKNYQLGHHDIYDGVPANKKYDFLLLDVPEPWQVFDKLGKIKVGGYIVTYTPSALQLHATMEAASERGLYHVRSVEVSERHWTVKRGRCRPTSQNVSFTAFLCFFRYLGEEWAQLSKEKN